MDAKKPNTTDLVRLPSPTVGNVCRGPFNIVLLKKKDLRFGLTTVDVPMSRGMA